MVLFSFREASLGGTLRRQENEELRVQGKSAPAEGTGQAKALWQDQPISGKSSKWDRLWPDAVGA